jgi:hypothetical protein
VLLTSMGICHEKLQHWNEAVTCYKEAVEHHRNLHGTSPPEYAIILSNLARLFADPSSTKRPSRALRRHLLSVEGCSVTGRNVLSRS